MKKSKVIVLVVIALIIGNVTGTVVASYDNALWVDELKVGNVTGTIVAGYDNAVWVDEIGDKVEDNGYTYYINSDNYYSAIIDDSDINWIHYNDQWIGISNYGNTVFEKGSRIVIHTVQVGSEEWDNFIKDFDDSIKENLQGAGSFIDIRVQKQDGTYYSKLNDVTQIYMEGIEDYDAGYLGSSEKGYMGALTKDSADIGIDGMFPEEGTYTVYLVSDLSCLTVGD